MKEKNIKDYGTIRIPQSLIGELQAWREAFVRIDNRPMTYECMFNIMLELLKEAKPDVYQEVSQKQ